MKILIVDDSMIIRNMVKRTVENHGGVATSANDGLEGLNIWRSNKNFDLILTDINMPNLNGFEWFFK